MSSRQLSIANKKLLGISRRLRSLTRWSESFENYFPTELSREERYWNIKIPVITSLVQGKQTSKELQAECAQLLISAAYKIFIAKPKNISETRITCCIVLPNMFSSELCIFTTEEYFNEHTNDGQNRFGKLERIKNRSLASEWGLKIPKEFFEFGVLRTSEDDDGNPYLSENWYFGEVSK